MQQGRFIRSLTIRAVRISHLSIKIIPKGMKWAAVGKIYTQSRDLVCRKFAFAYKKGYKRNEMDCGRGDLYAVLQFAPSGFHICV